MKMLYRLALFVLRWAHVASFRVAYFCPTVVNQDSISRNEVHFIVKTVESLRKVGYSQTFLYTEAESRLQLAHSFPTITEMSYVQVHIGSDGKLVGLKQSYDIFFALMREALPKLHGIASIFNVLVHHASNIIWHKKIAHKKQLLSSFDLVLLEHENWRRIFMKHMKRVLKKLQPSRLLRPLSVEAIVRMNGKDTDYNNFFSKRLYTLVQNAVYINRYRAVVQGNWTKLVDARLVAAPPGSTEKVAILFEREFNPLALLSVKSLMWKLGSSWGLKVFHGFNNRGYLKSLFSGISNVDFNWLPEGQTVNSILKSKYFWRNIEERHALIFHSDSLMLKGDVERFFKFDFIGAPASISMAKINRPALLNFSSELATSRKPYKDFESSEYLIGKFSLRNVSAMRMITSMFWSPREESEDLYFFRYLIKLGLSIPDISTARSFCVDNSLHLERATEPTTILKAHEMDLQPLSKIFHFVNTTHFVSNVWTHASHDLLNWMSWVSTAEMRLASGHDASFSSPSLSFPAVQLKNVFRLADDSYMKSVEHRGGWASILRRMITEGSISKDGRVLLLDIVEKWFYWSIIDGKPNPAIDTDWIGILHYVGGLPGHLPEIAKLESVLKVQTFRDSLPFCKGIIVLSLSQKKWLQTHFIQRGGYQVPIIALKHPIGSPDMRQFSMSGFINSENGRKVIALGTQYRKTATIYQMKVPYAKAWLPGTKDQKKIAWLRGHDFQALNYYPDLSSVDIMYTNSANEYDKMLVENIIVIDMWGASANNAVLECIASNTPFFVTALEAVKEYVGSSYPLLFNHYSEVERIVNNTRLLYESYRAAHRYLVALDKSALSTERFIESLVLASKGKYLSVPQTANLLVDNTRMDSLLLVVCGHGKAERTPVLQASIEHLVNSVSQNPSFRFRCLLYVHELTIFQNAVEHFPMCKVVLNKGKLWVSHMLQVGVVREDYVALLMDDIDIRGTNVFRMVNELKRVNFDVISSAIPGWHYKALLPRPECQSHRVAFVDMLFAVMTRNAWNCWQSQLDLSINHFGWGYDATFASLCGVKIGVSDMDTSQHAGHECATGGECTRTYDSSQAMDQLHNWLMLVYKLKTPKDVFERLKNMSETQYGYCEF